MKPKPSSTPKVVPLREVSAADIASQFRRMADEIDAGEIGHIESMVACGEIRQEIQIEKSAENFLADVASGKRPLGED